MLLYRTMLTRMTVKGVIYDERDLNGENNAILVLV